MKNIVIYDRLKGKVVETTCGERGIWVRREKMCVWLEKWIDGGRALIPIMMTHEREYLNWKITDNENNN